MEQISINMLWVLICATIVFLMQGGLCTTAYVVVATIIPVSTFSMFGHLSSGHIEVVICDRWIAQSSVDISEGNLSYVTDAWSALILDFFDSFELLRAELTVGQQNQLQLLIIVVVALIAFLLLRKVGQRYAIHVKNDSENDKQYAEATTQFCREPEKKYDQLEKLSVAVGQSPVAELITDDKGIVSYANQRFTEITGYSEVEVLEQPIRDICSGEMFGEHYGQMWETVQSGEIWRGEFKARKKNDEVFWISSSVSPIRNAEEGISHYLFVFEDITERKKLVSKMMEANEALIAVHQVHAQLFESTTAYEVAKVLTDAMVSDFEAYFACVWLVKDGDLCNECELIDACKTNEQCLHLVASSGHYTHIDGGHRRVPLGVFKNGLIAYGRGKTICHDVVNDERVHHRDWAQEHGLQTFAGFPLIRDGEVIGVMAMFSQKKLSQHVLNTLELLAQLGTSGLTSVEKTEALHSSQDYTNNIIESMVTSLVVFSPEGKIVDVNQATSKLLGYAKDELVGQPACLLFDEEGQCEFGQLVSADLEELSYGKKLLKKLVLTGHVTDDDCHYVAKDGNRIAVNFSGSVMRDTAGQIQGVVCVAQDITEQKQLQCELAQAQKLESVGQLAAGIAHEINTPTQYVGDNTRFLKDAFGGISKALDSFEELLAAVKSGEIDEELIAKLEKVLDEADIEYLTEEIPLAIDQSLGGVERVAKIVRAMKEFSHPGSDEMSIVNLADAIETTITVSHSEWVYVAEMETHFLTDLPDIYGLPGELNQVFLNLIVNASHAIADRLSDAGHDLGKITISTCREEDWAVITIKDNGTGMSEHILARIFDPFFTTKEVGRGTGQGLAIARSVIVDKHQGKLECTSKVGEGTVFTIRLPIQQELQDVVVTSLSISQNEETVK